MVALVSGAKRTRMSSARIKALKALARRVDAEEGAAITARGRTVFRRHERMRALVAALKARRLERGLSLAAVAARTGIAKPNLSRLENSVRAAPTLETLERYARAVGLALRVELVGRN
jgi:hypothetical protein